MRVEVNRMHARSIDATKARRWLGLAVGTTLVVTLAAGTCAQAQERSGDVTSVVESLPRNPLADSSGSTAANDEVDGLVVVGAGPAPRSEGWADFRRSVAASAIPSCFATDAVSHENFAAEGLLRAPLLVRAAVDGSCRSL
jgi:hypothetical protein